MTLLFLSLIFLLLLDSWTWMAVVAALGVSLLMMWAARIPVQCPRYKHLKRLPYSLYLAAYFMSELILSNLRILYEVLTPGFKMRPAVIGLRLRINEDVPITLLANLITLTPGTLSVRVSDDRKILYVHFMYSSGRSKADRDRDRKSLEQGFEERVMRLFR
jgi:multicomponent Na+:H+ antiporter subunit E